MGLRRGFGLELSKLRVARRCMRSRSIGTPAGKARDE